MSSKRILVYGLVFMGVVMIAHFLLTSVVHAADTNTVSSTVIDKSVGTANAPGININQNDSCGTANSIAIQSQILGIARGKAIIDLNCERIKLARVLGQSGLRVASVSVLCGDPSGRVFDAMWRAGTTCPFGSLLDQGLIGEEAKVMWIKNSGMIPEGSHFKKMIEQEKLAKAEKKKAANKVKKKKLKEKKVIKDETSTSKKGGLLLSIVTILLIL
tara:strand:- start:8 stop:655 length:648 start_codon:yes stop_codon:yes gene_type:complete